MNASDSLGGVSLTVCRSLGYSTEAERSWGKPASIAICQAEASLVSLSESGGPSDFCSAAAASVLQSGSLALWLTVTRCAFMSTQGLRSGRRIRQSGSKSARAPQSCLIRSSISMQHLTIDRRPPDCSSGLVFNHLSGLAGLLLQASGNANSTGAIRPRGRPRSRLLWVLLHEPWPRSGTDSTEYARQLEVKAKRQRIEERAEVSQECHFCSTSFADS